MKLAIIGGSLLKEPSFLNGIAEERIRTPFGEPSDLYATGNFAGHEIVYLNRHARKHHIAPHQVNYRANIFGLKMLDVTHVMAITAVGGITDKMSPMTWVIPDQLIDYTYGRMQTYNDGNEHEVKHIDFTSPFSTSIRDVYIQASSDAGIKSLHSATYGVTQGPRLETAAEIMRMENDGCDIVGMTAMPEAALARELDIEYATASLVVNWAAGKHGQQVSLEQIRQLIADGTDDVLSLIKSAISSLHND